MLPPPPTPLSERPTLGLKRDSSYIDTDDEHNLSASTKRLKVAFSPTVDVRVLDDWSEKSFELVKEEVRLAIERHRAPADQRDDTLYARVLQVLGQNASSSEAPSGKLLKKYLVAIDAKVSSLGDCGKLAAAAIDLPWLGRDDVFAGLYIKYLTSLATAHSKYAPSIMDKLVARFARLPMSLGRLPGETPVSRATMFARLHTAIKTLLRQVPSAAASLMRATKQGFPNDLETTRSYIQYQKHLLHVAEYAPELKADTLAFIMQRLVSIDVQIQLDIEDLEEEAEDRLLQGPNAHSAAVEPEDSDDSDIESVSESEETTTEDEQRLKELRLKVAKMDETLDLLFDYYDEPVRTGLKPDLNEAFQQLLAHFTTFVLPNRTRHAQFLLFHFAQTTPVHVAVFVKHCLRLAMDPSGSATLRLTSLAYLSSFVARGVHIPSSSVCDIFGILCESLDMLRKRYEPSCRGPDRRSYSIYYAVAQAVLYIFCFRWRDLASGSASPEPGDEDLSEDDVLAEGRDLAWVGSMKETFQRNIQSRLNPLKVCSPAIVGEFAKLAHHLRFLYVYSILETNKRVRLGQVAAYYGAGNVSDFGRRETAWDRKTGEAHLQLEAYFPFDPYQLPKSKRWVEADYNEWKLPAGMRQDDDEDDEDSELDESDDESLPEDADDLPVADTISISS